MAWCSVTTGTGTTEEVQALVAILLIKLKLSKVLYGSYGAYTKKTRIAELEHSLSLRSWHLARALVSNPIAAFELCLRSCPAPNTGLDISFSE